MSEETYKFVIRDWMCNTRFRNIIEAKGFHLNDYREDAPRMTQAEIAELMNDLFFEHNINLMLVRRNVDDEVTIVLQLDNRQFQMR